MLGSTGTITTTCCTLPLVAPGRFCGPICTAVLAVTAFGQWEAAISATSERPIRRRGIGWPNALCSDAFSAIQQAGLGRGPAANQDLATGLFRASAHQLPQPFAAPRFIATRNGFREAVRCDCTTRFPSLCRRRQRSVGHELKGADTDVRRYGQGSMMQRRGSGK